MSKPRIVQHSFGSLGSGGPIGALNRLMTSNIAQDFELRHVPQPYAAGGLNLKLILSMSKQMREFRPDLAHIRGLGNEGFHGVLAARIAGVPRILLSVHGSVRDLQSGPFSLRRWMVGCLLEPLSLLLATHVITVCEEALNKRVLQAVKGKVIGFVPNGVELTQPPAGATGATRSSFSIDDNDVVLIVVGRLVLDKGHLDLLEALKRLPEGPRGPARHLLIVGEGRDSGQITEAANMVGSFQVHMLGLRHDIPELLRISDIALIPSWHENMSNALLEAMAAGLPVIATGVGGNTEVLSHGGGLLVPPHDPSALALAIQRLVQDPALRVKLGLEARSVIESRYSVSHMVDAVRRVYLSILKGAL